MFFHRLIPRHNIRLDIGCNSILYLNITEVTATLFYVFFVIIVLVRVIIHCCIEFFAKNKLKILIILLIQQL